MHLHVQVSFAHIHEARWTQRQFTQVSGSQSSTSSMRSAKQYIHSRASKLSNMLLSLNIPESNIYRLYKIGPALLRIYSRTKL